MIRIGHGYDVHTFGGTNPLMICGVNVPHTMGVIAHSDGDVGLHALIDALLGALAMGDIGKFFPDTDPSLKGVDSRVLLKQVYAKMKQQNYEIGNADITLIAQAPKMRSYIDTMRQIIATELHCDIQQINVKATTTEQLGFVGRGEGIACEAVVLLTRLGNVCKI